MNYSILKSLPEKFLWLDITKFCKDFPDLVSFSEQKLNTAVLNRFYIEGGEDSPAEPVSTISTLCRVNTFLEKLIILTTF